MINEADASCHYGDHFWQENGFCSNCGTFNHWLLYEYQYQKAVKLGLDHETHYHRTSGAKQKCKRNDIPENFR